jgi:chitin synthase
MIRKKSLVKPDREKIKPGLRQWYYQTHMAELENNGSGRVGVWPSSTSVVLLLGTLDPSLIAATGNMPHRKTLQRGPSILGLEEDVHECGRNHA